MPFTPTDVINVMFRTPPLGKRGYNEDDVDAFLDLIHDELTRLTQENNALRTQRDLHQRVAFLDSERNPRPPEPPQLVEAPVPPARMEQIPPGGDHHVQASRMLSLAQETAERLTGDAQSEADEMLGEARTKSEQLLSDAQAKADGMINQARIQAETLLNDAQARAETLDRQSREKAEFSERDAAVKHAEITGSISQEKEILEKEIVELHTFEREYRTRLTTYLESHLRELDTRGPSVPTDPIRTQQDLVASG